MRAAAWFRGVAAVVVDFFLSPAMNSYGGLPLASAHSAGRGPRGPLFPLAGSCASRRSLESRENGRPNSPGQYGHWTGLRRWVILLRRLIPGRGPANREILVPCAGLINVVKVPAGLGPCAHAQGGDPGMPKPQSVASALVGQAGYDRAQPAQHALCLWWITHSHGTAFLSYLPGQQQWPPAHLAESRAAFHARDGWLASLPATCVSVAASLAGGGTIIDRNRAPPGAADLGVSAAHAGAADCRVAGHPCAGATAGAAAYCPTAANSLPGTDEPGHSEHRAALRAGPSMRPAPSWRGQRRGQPGRGLWRRAIMGR